MTIDPNSNNHSAGAFWDKLAGYTPGISTLNVLLNLGEIALMNIKGKEPQSEYLKHVKHKSWDRLAAEFIPIANLATLIRDVRDSLRDKTPQKTNLDHTETENFDLPPPLEKTEDLLALEALTAKANDGDLESMYQVGMELINPNSIVKNDPAQANYLFEKAAVQGHQASILMQGALLVERSEKGSPQQQQGVRLIEIAAHQNSDPVATGNANNLLCTLTLNGYTSRPMSDIARYELAFKALQKASDPDLQYLNTYLGQKFEDECLKPGNSDDVETLRKNAFECFQHGAERGDKDSTIKLAYLYNEGIGTKANPQKALEAIKTAHNIPFIPQKFSLGFIPRPPRMENLAPQMKNKDTEAYKLFSEWAAVHFLHQRSLVPFDDQVFENDSRSNFDNETTLKNAMARLSPSFMNDRIEAAHKINDINSVQMWELLASMKAEESK